MERLGRLFAKELFNFQSVPPTIAKKIIWLINCYNQYNIK
mgnify:CR=1 FL=1